MISNIVVGSGMLARAFQKSKSDGCTFFCSGVSNSTEINSAEFEREAALLKKSLQYSDCLVYFSSILATTKQNKYYEHKDRMEQLVKSLSDEYIIVRLPQVAGEVLNNTLLPNFIKKIYFEEKFEIYNNAPRSLIDVEDVVTLFDNIYRNNIRNQTINFCPGYEFQPIDLVRVIGDLLGKKPNINIVHKESIQLCEQSSLLSEYVESLGDLNTYLERVAKKYTERIVDMIERSIKK